jgi:hypothetical protein
MFLQIQYCQGYGWHCGRLLLWLILLVIGIPLAFVAVFLEEILRALTHIPAPIALCLPLAFALALFRRLWRKFHGRPFAVRLPEFFMDDMTVWLIPRGHRHFRALVILEIFIWGSVIAAQLGIIGVCYHDRFSRSHHAVLQKEPPSKTLQAAAVLCSWMADRRHNAVVAGASTPPAAVPELVVRR